METAALSRRSLLAASALLGVTALPSQAAAAPRIRNGWTGSWSAAPGSATTELGTTALTIRNVVHTSLGGQAIRIHLTNAFGPAPLTLTQLTAALPISPGNAAAQPETMRPVTFGGQHTPTIPAGAEAISDPIDLAIPADSDLLISVAVPANSGPATFHLHATQTNYLAQGDNHATDPTATAFTKTTPSWFYVNEVDVWNPAHGTVVTLGDSITDGVTSRVGLDHRWPDYLARRLHGRCGVLNAGISGNRVLLDGAALAPGYAAAGQSAVARLQRDVLSRPGVRTLIVFEGINDLIWTPNQLDPQAITWGLTQIAQQAQAAGIHVIGATLTPATGYAGGFNTQQEATRQAVNTWLRETEVFDAITDFDAVLRDPADPPRIAPRYDSGDHLHPNDTGYQALANSLKLDEIA